MTRKSVQLIREGERVAEVSVEIEEAGAWGATVGFADIAKLDRVRRALRAGDIRGALEDAKVYRLVPEIDGGVSARGFGEDPQTPLNHKPK